MFRDNSTFQRGIRWILFFVKSILKGEKRCDFFDRPSLPSRWQIPAKVPAGRWVQAIKNVNKKGQEWSDGRSEMIHNVLANQDETSKKQRIFSYFLFCPRKL